MQTRVVLLVALVALTLGCQGAELSTSAADPDEVAAVPPGPDATAANSAAVATATASSTAPKHSEVFPTTVLPPSFRRPLTNDQHVKVLVPAGMLSLSSVTRPRAELRRGPGVQFELADDVLERDSEVAVFGKVGVWERVLVLNTWQRGWIHEAALTPSHLNAKPRYMDMSRLPTVIATRDIRWAQPYQNRTSLKVSIPRGAVFQSLRLATDTALVWLPDTDSVLWISRKDVK